MICFCWRVLHSAVYTISFLSVRVSARPLYEFSHVAPMLTTVF